ncbi:MULTISPECIES: DNA methyltransferase [unclassified Methylobacterium]|uniref:DNA methyltransferase n=1 Tax=unclassified Methylobacterium TaxID=2615210 RepID=UPI0036F9B58A
MTYHARPDETAEWLNYLQPEGLVVGPNVLREAGRPPERQTPRDTEVAAAALGLDPEAPRDDDRRFVLADPWRFLNEVLRWPAASVAGAPGGPALARTVPEQDTLIAPDLALLWADTPETDVPAQALVLLHPTLDADARNAFGEEWEASPHQRLERLLRETGIGVGVLVARNVLRLVYAPKGETAGWLSWPLAALGRVEGRPMLAGLKLLLGRQAFFTGAPATRLRALLRASREAQNAVSEKLSGQVLGALHELMRGLHRAAPDTVEAMAEAEPHHLYEGLLTCLMRLVFLLYAEDRDLLPSTADPGMRQLWESGYSIKTLYARLLVDEALNPDTMDQRRGAWGQLLATCRLIHDGHDDFVARRGGKLFDPDAFPFLEGRTKGSPRKAGTVLPVGDGTVLRILHGLMTIEGRALGGERVRERLSYRALDVESIGSVYETVMGFTARRATEAMLALRDDKRLPTFVGLDALLTLKPADRQKSLKEQSVSLSPRQAKAVKEAGSVADLVAAFGTLVDERASPEREPIPAGAPYLQPTEERRRSGSHYTPRSLTEPIVRHALEPAFERIGKNASPEAVLSLKVCDPACGSGAFLVEACRQLGTRLEQAWDMFAAEKPAIPADEDEATHARRLVAQRCLYGVDRNPMAVDLARLSLWLATLAREHEFSFLDHALKSGDSLVGLTLAEIKAAHWDASKPGLPLFREAIAKAVARATEGREAIRTAGNDVLTIVQASRHRRVEDEVQLARDVGDAVVAAFFSADKPKARETARQTVESWIGGQLSVDGERMAAEARRFRATQGWRPFHWEIEFPEVFLRENAGFDAIVGNPPFAGKSTISEGSGSRYLPWLQILHKGAHGNADLVAHFFRRAFNLLRQASAFGLIATNTIGQGDTRQTGLATIIGQGGSIARATKRYQWPNEGAAVIVSIVHVHKANKVRSAILNGQQVPRISAYLVGGDFDENPNRLLENLNKAFNGTKIYGQGFLFADNDDETTPVFEMRRLIDAHPVYKNYIRPYLGGDDMNNSPDCSPSRFVIDISSLSLCEAESLPDLIEIVRNKVLPERLKTKDNADGRILKRDWWKFFRPKNELYKAVALANGAIVTPETSPHLNFAQLQVGITFSHALKIIAMNGKSPFATLQSRTHETWARFFASTLEDRLRYTPSDCFETFPFPPGYETDQTLEAAGQTYHDHRAALMVAADEGMTKTYNRFHKSDEHAPAIVRLRELHDAMDRAVLRAYGWDDLANTLRPEFLTPETEDDHTYQGRYFWPAEGRDLVLSRLLALNAERHAEEVAAGLVPVKGRARPSESEPGENPGLFDDA